VRRPLMGAWSRTKGPTFSRAVILRFISYDQYRSMIIRVRCQLCPHRQGSPDKRRSLPSPSSSPLSSHGLSPPLSIPCLVARRHTIHLLYSMQKSTEAGSRRWSPSSTGSHLSSSSRKLLAQELLGDQLMKPSFAGLRRITIPAQ